MARRAPHNKAARARFWWVFALLELLLLVPIGAADYLPYVDLPQHLATIAVLNGLDDPSTGYQDLFFTDLFPNTNVTFFWLTAGIARWLPLEAAVRVVIALYLLSLPPAVVWLAQVVRGEAGEAGADAGHTDRTAPPWAALLVFPLVYNSIVQWGFFNYLLAIPPFLVLVGLTLRYREGRASRRDLAWMVVLPVGLFLTHAQLYLFAGASAAVLASLRLEARRRWAGLVLAWTPSMALFGAWYADRFVQPDAGSRLEFKGAGKGFGAEFLPLAARLGQAPDYLFELYAGPLDTVLLAAWLALAVAWIRWGWVARPGARSGAGEGDRAGARGAMDSRWFGVMALSLAALLCYFVLPIQLWLQYCLSSRMLILCPLLAVAAVAARATVRRALIVATVSLSVMVLALIAREHRAFDREMAPLSGLLEKIPPRQKVLGLSFTRRSEHAVSFVFLHAAAYYLTLEPGIIGHSFMILPSSPVRYRSPGQLSLIQPNRELRPWCALLEGQAADADYLLVHGPDPGLMAALEPQVQLVEQVQRWGLYRRVAPIVLSEERLGALRASLKCPGWETAARPGAALMRKMDELSQRH
jgi:hypothetical protein